MTLYRLAAQQPNPQQTSFARAGPYPGLPPQISPTQLNFPHTGPPSPFNSSAPGSPFSTLHAALMTTLPPTSSSIPTSYSYTPVGTRAEQSYFPRPGQPVTTAAGMYPPPHPTLSRPPSTVSEPRPSTARERRRPEPLGNLQLPPIVSSAPTTPMTSQFFEGSQSQPGSMSRRRSPERNSDEDEEESRKRRRLNIKEIIEK